jgi:Rrf2 family protein
VRIQNRTEYGVRALVLLAEREGERLSSAKIVEIEAIPESFLEQILVTLRRAGLVEAVRGVNGGYRLARPAAAITMAEVIRVLEGSLSPIGCIDEGIDPLAFCARAGTCHTRKVWVRMTESITVALSGLTLADVIDRGS